MDNLGDKVLRKIKEECICPKPRWQFLLKDYFIWFLFLISLLLGSLAFCVALYTLSTNDWDLYQYLHTTLVGHILISIPYLWIIFLIIFVFIAYYNFKYTKSGYRRETYFVVGLSVVGSLFLGAFLHTLGVGEKIEEFVSVSVPEYEMITCCSARKDIWVQPARGLLAGEIVGVIDERNFELKDFLGSNWQIQESDDTLEYEPLQIQLGEDVKIIGEKKQDFVFWAREIRPWKNKGEVHKAKVRFEIE
jgi:heme/copper-type cytochrome/quinol oxidase subunit 2